MTALFSDKLINDMQSAFAHLAEGLSVMGHQLGIAIRPVELQRTALKTAIQEELDQLDPLEQIVIEHRIEVTVPGYVHTTWHTVKAKGKTKSKTRRRKIKTWVPVQEYLLEKSDVEMIAEKMGFNVASVVIKNETVKGYDPSNDEQEVPEIKIVIERAR